MLQKEKLAPAFKNHVIEAVAALQEKRGSTSREIVNQIKAVIRRSPRYKERLRNLILQVERALHHCVDDGLLRHQAGRYKLGIKNDKIMKITECCQLTENNPKTKSPDKKQVDRMGNKRKRRRISTSSSLSRSSAASSTGVSETSASSVSRSRSAANPIKGCRRRRKGKKGKKKGRKGKKRRRRSVSHSEDSEKSSDSQNPPDNLRSEQIDSELASTSFSGNRKRLRGGRSYAGKEYKNK